MKLLSKVTLIFLITFYNSLYAKDHSLDVTELMHLTPAGRLQMDSTFSYQSSYFKKKNDSSLSFTEYKSSHISVQESIRYGLLEDVLEIAFKFGVAFAGSKQVIPSGQAEIAFDYVGLYDPSLLLKYRILNEKSSFARLDLLSEFSPSFENFESGDLNNAGNITRGGHQFSLGFELGNYISTFSWKLGVKFHMLLKQTVSDSSGAEIQENDARSNIETYGNLKFYVFEQNSIDLGLGIISIAGYNQTQIITLSETTLGNALDIQIKAQFNYLIDSNFSVSPHVLFTFGGDRDVTSKLVSGDKEIERTELDLGLSINYQF